MKWTARILAGAIGVCSGCESLPPPTVALDGARQAVHAAQADVDATRFAPMELNAAAGSLAAAEAAASSRRFGEARQAAYLAVQRARLARLRGAARASDERVHAGEVARALDRAHADSGHKM